ncbi:MAG TPA: DUF2723 domain-containing protein [Thermoanaerobaculia bacterium]
MSSRLEQLLVAGGVFVAALVVYSVTLTPTVGLVDSGALTVAAWSLGNAHPPGFPLYLLLTKLFMFVPFGSIAVRANFASAFFGALACAMVALTIAELLLYRGTPKPKDAKKKVSQKKEPEPQIPIVMAFGGLLFTFARTLWGYATVAEVYALNTFLIVTIFWLLLSWRRTQETWRIVAAALVFGLALGVHHVTVGLTIAAMAVLVFRTGINVKTFVVCALVAIVAVAAIYAYLPLAASHGASLNWGNPDNAERFIRHVTAKQYRSYVSTGQQSSQFAGIMSYVTRELGPRWLPLALLVALAGLWQALRRDVSLFWFLALTIAGNVAWALVYPIANDKDAYLLPTFVALTLAAAYALSRVSRTIAAAMLILPLVAAVVHWPYRDRSDFGVTREYVDNAFRAMEPNALLMTNNWQLYAPMRYFLDVEKQRPDVKVIEHGMLIRGWYVDSLVQRYPELMRGVSYEFAAFRPYLDHFEADDEIWRNDPTMSATMNARLDDLILAMVRTQLESGGHVYATPDVALSREAVDANLVQRFAQEYDTVPRGVLMELLRGHAIRNVPTVPIEMKSALSGRYESDDVVVTEVRPAYRQALLLRGRYLGLSANYDEAIRAYEQALALDPTDVAVQQELQQARAAKAQRGG